ncbi:MAG: T9SS type A sorting domain-containing protein [Candidatus Kapabacteria bacterium]|nr:T9SS type A sorting domain-containing protein [Ignavibacteriota bacterium]MCW5885157.1 T9SS type A sorting domain-containing protein [Candidatus Kapabacteria bacterium]
MKKIFALIFVLLFVAKIAFSQELRNVDSRDFAVLLSAEVSINPPSIKLIWEKNELASQYRIHKKRIADYAFGNEPIAILDSLTTEYTDPNVLPGVAYEYEVWALQRGTAQSNPMSFWGFGYLLTGIDVPEYDQPGYVLLLIDETMKDALSSEILRLKNDLRAEGWGILERYVPRTEQFDGQAVKSAKQIVIDEYNKYRNDLKSIYILGRVAVPYSGDIYPDAHPDHRGAWPADIYYGYPNELLWTDVSVNMTVASREANKNIPGDGKFDQSSIGTSLASIAVGRVDLYGMKAFHGELQNPEAVLLKRYLDKNHNYRNGQFDYEIAGIIDDNFAAHNIVEAFASSGWRNIGSLAGRKNVKKADFFTTLGTESKLFAYGCGGGSYTSAGGIGNTNDFATKDVNAVFTMLFGSYFGDWDIDNNFLRAPLATNPMALTCSWAGRPHWYYHHMAFGYPIGYSALLSHNNTNTYKPNIVYTAQYPNGVIFSIGMRNIHTALMGDPTLKLSPYSVPSPDLVKVSVPLGESDDIHTVKIEWSAPEIATEHHFNIYRSTDEFGKYEKLNSNPLKGTEFIDTLSNEDFYRFDGDIYYLVRTAMLETNNSGRYYNVSRGRVGSAFVTSVNSKTTFNSGIKINPNPATDLATIQFTNGISGPTEIEVVDLSGNQLIILLHSDLYAGTHTVNWDLKTATGLSINPGVYFVRMKNGNKIYVEKLIKM